MFSVRLRGRLDYEALLIGRASRASVICLTGLLDEGEEELAEPKRLFLLNPVTSPVNELDITHLRHRLGFHQIERAWCRIAAPIVLSSNEE